MAFAKKWKNNWELKSLTLDELFEVVIQVVLKQLDKAKKSDIKLETEVSELYDADSVDVIAMLLYLEDVFKNASPTSRTVVPTDRLGEIVIVEDILEIIYDVLLGIENKMENFVPIKPDFASLEKRTKVGQLYAKT
jgi:acyl carrier protein